MSAALQAVKQFRAREINAAVLKVTQTEPAASKAPLKIRNPFLPFKNPESGRWAPPKYSLRRQAELVKNARACGMLHLLPPGPKLSTKELASAPVPSELGSSASASASDAAVKAESSEEAAPSSSSELESRWAEPVEWEGELKEKEVKGADVGNRLYAGRKRMFKGHKWERTQEKRTWERKMLMKDMQERIERFRTTYRRKTPSPVSPARPVSYSKLPF